MNDNDMAMYDYLISMGAMRPEENQLARRQAMVDALRQQSMDPMRGQMAGRVYVAPGIGDAIAKVGTAYMAGQQQQGVDTSMGDMNMRRANELRRMRERMMQRRNPAAAGIPISAGVPDFTLPETEG